VVLSANWAKVKALYRNKSVLALAVRISITYASPKAKPNPSAARLLNGARRFYTFKENKKILNSGAQLYHL
jgi:hypothetical protein